VFDARGASDSAPQPFFTKNGEPFTHSSGITAQRMM
jgi:hypothetical protein